MRNKGIAPQLAYPTPPMAPATAAKAPNLSRPHRPRAAGGGVGEGWAPAAGVDSAAAAAEPSDWAAAAVAEAW